MGERYHAFLSYFSRLEGVMVHPDVLEKARTIAQHLSQGENENTQLNVFLQTNQFGAILPQLIEGLDNSGCYVILVTQDYMIQANTSGSMIQNEFLYALDELGLQKCIICVLESEMMNRRNWKGIFKFRLGAFAPIDMSTPELIDANIGVLAEQIQVKNV